MPRKLIADSSRGWYGWEARFNSVIRMSTESMMTTNVKNERERYRHNNVITRLRDQERTFAAKSNRDYRDTRKELVEMLAYRKVYRQYSFYRADQWDRRGPREIGRIGRQSLRLPEVGKVHAQATVSTKTSKTKEDCITSDKYGPGETRVLPEVVNNKIDQVSETGKAEEGVSTRGTYPSTSIQVDTSVNNASGERAASPEVEDKVAVDVNEDSPRSQVSISRSGTDFLKPREDTETKKQELYQERLPNRVDSLTQGTLDEIAPPNLVSEVGPSYKVTFGSLNLNSNWRSQPAQKPKADVWERVIPKPHPKKSSIFPEDCRSSFTLRKFIDRKAETLIKEWSPENARKEKVKKILDGLKLPRLVERSKTTSAIFRDYRKLNRRGSREDSGDEHLDTPRPQTLPQKTIHTVYGDIPAMTFNE